MKLSVVCSTYNSSKWIAHFIESLNQQLLSSFEVLFIDANSTDGSLETIQRAQWRDGISVRIIQCPTRISITASMNLGVKEALGEYIVLYSTDDYLFPSALLTYLGYATIYPDIDLIYSDFYLHETIDPFQPYNMRRWPEHSHATLLKFCYGGPFPCLKKAAVQRAGLFNERYTSSSDYDMWLRMSKMGCRLQKINEVIGSFCFRQDSISNQNLAIAQQEDREIQLNNQ